MDETAWSAVALAFRALTAADDAGVSPLPHWREGLEAYMAAAGLLGTPA